MTHKKVSSPPVVFEAPEPSGRCLECLYSGIEALCGGVGDSMGDVAEYAFGVAQNGLGNCGQFRYSLLPGVSVPVGKERPGLLHAQAVEEAAEYLLEAPDSGGLLGRPPGDLELVEAGFLDVLAVAEEEVLAPF